MKKLTVILICLFAIALSSCKKDQQSLQEYLVESREKPNFESFDISSSMINGYLTMADDEIKESVKSIHKINLLGLPIKGNEAAYEAEKTKLNAILANSEDYKPLLKVKKEGVKLNLFYEGTPENINEVIVYGYTKEYGLGLARLTGNNIKTDKLIKLIKNAEVPKGVLKGFTK